MKVSHFSKSATIEMENYSSFFPHTQGCLAFTAAETWQSPEGELPYCFTLSLSDDDVIAAENFGRVVSLGNVGVLAEVVKCMQLTRMFENLKDVVLVELLKNQMDVEQAFEFDDLETTDYVDMQESIEQFQGLLAHRLGYSACKTIDSQGDEVYIIWMDKPFIELDAL